MLRKILGISLIIAGIFLGLYLGVWVCFIGGIVGVVVQISASEINALLPAWNILKVVCAGTVGVLAGSAVVFIGVYLTKD